MFNPGRTSNVFKQKNCCHANRIRFKFVIYIAIVYIYSLKTVHFIAISDKANNL